MEKKFKVGILKETKTQPDRRVVIPPQQAVEMINKFSNIELFVQPSDIRCYKDEEYKQLGLTLKEDLSDCDVLMKFINMRTIIDYRHPKA